MKITISTGLAIIALSICFIMVPVTASVLGGWYAYWGAMLLGAVWAVILLWLKLTKYWEDE